MKVYIIAFVAYFLTNCSGKETSQIAENTFVYGNKVYKLIDNEIREIGDLSNDIKKFEILKPKERDLGKSSLSYSKDGASASLKALYRGSSLYYKLQVFGFNDLKKNYSPGIFTIEFIDEFGFILHSTEVMTNQLVGNVDNDNKVLFYEYNGKTEMSTEINSSIKTFGVTSSVKAKSSLSW